MYKREIKPEVVSQFKGLIEKFKTENSTKKIEEEILDAVKYERSKPGKTQTKLIQLALKLKYNKGARLVTKFLKVLTFCLEIARGLEAQLLAVVDRCMTDPISRLTEAQLKSMGLKRTSSYG
jgi:hypothetical protein